VIFENGKIKIRRGAKTIVKIEEPKNSVQPRGGALFTLVSDEGQQLDLRAHSANDVLAMQILCALT